MRSCFNSGAASPTAPRERDAGSPQQPQQQQAQAPSLQASASQQRPRDLQVFTYADLKAATRNFNRANLLGEGGFGCVYKGIVKRGGEEIEVAVKKLNEKSVQGHKEWLTEVLFLEFVEHPNLVKLVGYCSADDNRGIHRLLVYEYLPGRSVEVHLFFPHFPVLSWHNRVRIALGAARGLAYLHEGMDSQVIFRDFKSANILLDDDLNAKLSDFGLARQGPQGGESHVSTAIVGTQGYAAPEYIQTGHLTAKSDVWSFGVVLLEFLTGRKALDRNAPRDEQRLVDWVRPFLKGGKKFAQLIDPRLENKYPLKAAQKFALLAAQCLHKYARMRPKMSEVVESLEAILKISGSRGSPRSVMELPDTPSRPRPWSLRQAISSIFTPRDSSWKRAVKTF